MRKIWRSRLELKLFASFRKQWRKSNRRRGSKFLTTTKSKNRRARDARSKILTKLRKRKQLRPKRANWRYQWPRRESLEATWPSRSQKLSDKHRVRLVLFSKIKKMPRLKAHLFCQVAHFQKSKPNRLPGQVLLPSCSAKDQKSVKLKRKSKQNWKKRRPWRLPRASSWI